MRYIDYLYTYKKEHLLVSDMPVEACPQCGMVYYNAATLKRVEERFFAIRDKRIEPDGSIQIPTMRWVSTISENGLSG